MARYELSYRLLIPSTSGLPYLKSCRRLLPPLSRASVYARLKRAFCPTLAIFRLISVSFDLKQLDVFRKHFGTFTKIFLSMLMAHTPTFQRKTRACADFRIFLFSVLDRKERGSFTPCSISSNLLGSFFYLCSPCFSHIFCFALIFTSLDTSNRCLIFESYRQKCFSPY